MGPIPACSKCITLWHSTFEDRAHPGVLLNISIHQCAAEQSIHLLQERVNLNGEPAYFKAELGDSKATEYASHLYKGFLESDDFIAAFKPVVSNFQPARPPPRPSPLPSVKEEDKYNDDDDDDDDNEEDKYDDKEPRQRSKTSAITLDTLSQYFHLTGQEASKALNISGTTLKKICRHHGLPRWPHRKFKSFGAKEGAIR